MPVSEFGRMDDGSAVEAITIAADGIDAKILTFGATLADLIVASPRGPRSVILGFDDLQSYLDHGGYFGAIAGRCANRIAGGRFALDGHEHQLDVNEAGRTHLHGGTAGFFRRNWTVVDTNETSVLLGLPITAANGVIWGIGGFVAFQLAPALGLAPELPGMPAADLGARQVWWWGTALATGAGLLAVAKLRNWTGIGIAAVLLLAPHIIGAPQLTGDHTSAVPAHLATEFAAAALATGALFWLTVGPLLGWLTELFARREAMALKGAHA